MSGLVSITYSALTAVILDKFESVDTCDGIRIIPLSLGFDFLPWWLHSEIHYLREAARMVAGCCDLCHFHHCYFH